MVQGPNRDPTFAVPATSAADTISPPETIMQPTSRRSLLGWVAATAIITLLPSALCHAAATPMRHRFLAVDDGTHTLVHVDESDPARNWSVATGYVMDMQLVGQDRVLLSVDDGFREYEVASGKLLKSVKGAGGKSYSVYRTTDGRTLLTGDDLGGQKGACLVVYDRADKIIERKVFDGLTMLRHLRPTPEGTYLLAAVGQVVEVDARWNIIRQSKARRQPVQGGSAGQWQRPVLFRPGRAVPERTQPAGRSRPRDSRRPVDGRLLHRLPPPARRPCGGRQLAGPRPGP